MANGGMGDPMDDGTLAEASDTEKSFAGAPFTSPLQGPGPPQLLT